MDPAETDRERVYGILSDLQARLPTQHLSACDGKCDWPHRGVYFFFEPRESRPDGKMQRVVRVGTHALKAGAGTTLWGRLAQHRGTASNGGGNHRGSVFRRHVGSALLARPGSTLACSTWGEGSNAPKPVRAAEQPVEQPVSRCIGAMPFVWVEADDEPGPGSIRGSLESNLIALLSCIGPAGATADRPSEAWLGQYCSSEWVRRSGLWNVHHVEGRYDPEVVSVLEACASKTRPLGA